MTVAAIAGLAVSSRMLRLGAVPEEAFREYVTETKRQMEEAFSGGGAR
jgi:hypothetical protein